MLSITNVSTAQAGSYYQKDSYYAAEPGEWQGRGADALGLRGEITYDDFKRVVRGFDPRNPDIEKPFVGDGANGTRRAGTDLTFSAGKGLSLQALVHGDMNITLAHREAVSATLDYIEQHYGQVREMTDGVSSKVYTGNLVIAKFDHSTSRELDPQLHTHALVLNLSQKKDGSWRALSNEKLYEAKMFIGQYYRSEVAARIVEQGYAIETQLGGLFDLRGVDEKLKEVFSSRSEQIDNKMNELRKDYPNAADQKLREMAALGSRVAKQDVDMSIVRELWNARLSELGYSREGIDQAVKSKARRAEAGKDISQQMSSYDAVRTATRIITEQESVFTKEELLRTAGALTLGTFRISELERITRGMEKNGELIKMGNEYTTVEMKRIEALNVRLMKTGQGQETSIMSEGEAKSLIQSNYPYLTHGQASAFTNILTTHDRIIGVQGYAGTGKTTLFHAIREQAESQGLKIQGLSFTGKAAEEIQKNSGITSSTIDSFFARGQKMESDAIYVVDEASMIGSRHVNRLERMAIESKARLVLSGDAKQLPAISAGCPFAELQKNGMSTTVMGEIVRQKDGAYREIVKDIVDVKIDNAFEKLAAHDKLKVIPDRAERIEEIVRSYTKDEDWRNTIITTQYNADRDDLNGKIRETLQERGELGRHEIRVAARVPKSLSPLEHHFAQSYQRGDHIFARFSGSGMRAGAEGQIVGIDSQAHTLFVEKSLSGEKVEIDLKTAGEMLTVFQEQRISLAPGEKVVFLKNDSQLGLKNGQTAEFKKVDSVSGKLMFERNSGRVQFTIEEYNYLDYGYARTVHKGQGVTERNVIVHAPANGQSYNSFYVGVTRGQYNVKVFTDDRQALEARVREEIEKTSSYREREREQETGLSDERKADSIKKDQGLAGEDTMRIDSDIPPDSFKSDEAGKEASKSSGGAEKGTIALSRGREIELEM